jgi:hypothetical protein
MYEVEAIESYLPRPNILHSSHWQVLTRILPSPESSPATSQICFPLCILDDTVRVRELELVKGWR